MAKRRRPAGRYITLICEHLARLWPAYLMRHGPYLARLVFSNERARFPHVSDFPLFPNNYSDSLEKFPNFHLSPKISRFSSARISDDRRSFLAIDHKFRIPPTFAISIHFSPISGNEELRKFFISPYFSKFPLH